MSKKPWFVALMIIVLEIIIVAVLVPGDFTGRSIQTEQEMIEKSLGADTLSWVRERSGGWFQTTMIDSGVKSGIYNHLIPTEEQKARSVGLEKFGEGWFNLVANRIDSLMLVVQQSYMRLALLSIWAPYMLLLLIPAIYDGMQTWRIKVTNFDYASPVLHRYSVRLLGLSLASIVILFLSPLPVPPSATPVILMVMCVAIGLVIGNYQKRI